MAGGAEASSCGGSTFAGGGKASSEGKIFSFFSFSTPPSAGCDVGICWARFSQSGKSSSLSVGRKLSILPQVTPHRGVGWPCSVKKRPRPLVSITSNMFFRDSGSASANRSELALVQNWPMISRMESQSAENVGRLERGLRCCRNTLDSIMAALSLVSSLPSSSSFLNIGKRTRRKANSH